MRLMLIFSGPSNDENAFYEIRAQIDPATPADTRSLAEEFMEHAVTAMHALNERNEMLNERNAFGEDT